MNKLQMLPPITASYMNKPGPKITLSYCKLSRIAQKNPPLFIPWSYGGRKFDLEMNGDYDVLNQTILDCKEYYQKRGFFPENFIDSDERDSDFKELVYSTLHSQKVSTETVKTYIDHKRNMKKLVTDRFNGNNFQSELHDLLTINTKDLLSVSQTNLHSIDQGRLKRSLEKPYILQIYRENAGKTHWDMDQSFNQRFVSIHWLKYAHERFKPEELDVFCGTTVEYKWLIPSLALLNSEQIDKTNIYLHGSARNIDFLQNREDIDTPLALASKNIGSDINYTSDMFSRVSKLKRKINNIEKYFCDYAQNGAVDINLTELEKNIASIDDSFSIGRNQQGLDLLTNLLFTFYNDLIGKAKEQGISFEQKKVIFGGLSHVRNYCS
ncbi:MAG: hypothetical protein ACMXYD_05475 [Candidatus Woesearchaeota archaeon]